MIEADGGPHKIALDARWGLLPFTRIAESRKCCSSPSAEYLAAENSEEAAIIWW
jgi:hypothetical protein